MHHLAFSSVLGTMVLKLLQQLFHKLQIRLETVKCPWNTAAFISWFIHQLLENTLVSWASRAIHQNLLHCIHLSLLCTAICYTHFYCYKVPYYLLSSALHCHYLISGFLLWRNSFVSANQTRALVCPVSLPKFSSPSSSFLCGFTGHFFFLMQVYLLMYQSFKIPLNKY